MKKANSIESVIRQWRRMHQQGRINPATRTGHGTAVQESVRLLAGLASPVHPLEVSGQPFDSLLLRSSQLYRRSRLKFQESRGVFTPSLASSPRTLSSAVLLEHRIEYSPVEAELIWSATDPLQSRDVRHLLQVRTYVSGVYHEQNHRLLWRLLPPAPADGTGIRKFLNFAESLVIMLDMALADRLARDHGLELPKMLYLCGAIYDPGSSACADSRSRRGYRNYLQAAMHSTYLNLELYEPKDIARGIRALFPQCPELAERAALRSGNLDREFIVRTNQLWQKKHQKAAVQKLSQSRSGGARALRLPDDPIDNREQYLIAEGLMDLFGI